MKQTIAVRIVRYRWFILAVMLLAAVISAACISKTTINYDLNRYLDDNTMTKRALKVMQEEFGINEQLRVMFEDLDADALSGVLDQLNALPEVLLAAHDPETDVRVRDGARCQLVTLTLRECDASALVRKLRGMFPGAGRYYVGGSAASMLDVQNSVGREMPLVMAIALVVVLAVLLFTSHAWLEPVVILLVLGVSVVINLGTHFVFPDVSFITFAVSAILQLALSIDYAIMLLHTYNGRLDEGLAAEEAMVRALEECFMRISSSALTTVAGLLSLLFMSFTIGFDIGLALSKGILISMLCVFLLMPAVTLLFEKPLRLSRHRPVALGGERLARFIYQKRRAIAAGMILLVGAGAVLQSMNRYTFTDGGQSLTKGESQEISSVFGSSAPLALLIPGGTEDSDYDLQRTLAEDLLALTADEGQPAVRSVTAMVTVGAEALKYMTPQDVADMTGLPLLTVRLFYMAQGFGDSVRADRLLAAAGQLGFKSDSVSQLQEALAEAEKAFHGKRYDRMLLELSPASTQKQLTERIDRIQEIVRGSYGEDFYLTGVPMSTYDIGNAFRGDLLKVNLITFLAILLIVSVSFRSFLLPLMLVFVIEGAIWVSMGISFLLNQPIFFISYLICVSIQMGATIDYGILISDQYQSARKLGLSVPEALRAAMKKGMPTVLTSGVILVTAGFLIGVVCSIFYISDIGLLLARGTLVSVILVFTLLPALLTLCDRWILRKPGNVATVPENSTGK